MLSETIGTASATLSAELSIQAPLAPYQVINNTYQSSDSIWPGIIGGFAGAFAAFIFGLITFYLQKKFERYWKHKNAVVEIEHLLNDHLNTSSGNQYLLKGAIDTLNAHHMSYTLLDQFRLPEDLSLRIGNLEVLNKYFDYEEPAKKLNHGLKAWQGMNEALQRNTIANPSIPPVVIHENMKHLSNQAGELVKFLIGLDQDTIALLAYVRVFMRKDRNIWSLWMLEKRRGEKSVISKAEIKKELKLVIKEAGEISSESKKRIAKIQKI